MKKNVTLVLLVVVLAACFTLGLAQDQKLRVIITTWPGSGPLFIAQEMGFWEELGLEVEILVVPAPQ